MGVEWSGRRDDDDDPISPVLHFIVAHQNLISLTTHFIPFFSLTKPKRQSSIQFVDQLRVNKQAPDPVLVLRSHKNEAKQKQNVRRLASSYAPVAAPIHNAKRPCLSRHTGDSTYRPASNSLPPSCAASPRRELWHQPEGLEAAGRHPADHPPQL
jgi:hypothetical protein